MSVNNVVAIVIVSFEIICEEFTAAMAVNSFLLKCA